MIALVVVTLTMELNAFMLLHTLQVGGHTQPTPHIHTPALPLSLSLSIPTEPHPQPIQPSSSQTLSLPPPPTHFLHHPQSQIPKASAFNKIRLTLVALLAIPSAAEYYDFIANPLAVRLGPNAWCMLAVMQVRAVLRVRVFVGSGW